MCPAVPRLTPQVSGQCCGDEGGDALQFRAGGERRLSRVAMLVRVRCRRRADALCHCCTPPHASAEASPRNMSSKLTTNIDGVGFCQLGQLGGRDRMQPPRPFTLASDDHLARIAPVARDVEGGPAIGWQRVQPGCRWRKPSRGDIRDALYQRIVHQTLPNRERRRCLDLSGPHDAQSSSARCPQRRHALAPSATSTPVSAGCSTTPNNSTSHRRIAVRRQRCCYLRAGAPSLPTPTDCS